jgi:hypothetical protein
MKKSLIPIALVAAAAGGAAALAFGPALAGADTTTTSPPATSAPAAGATPSFHGHEDAAHEAAESPEREAAEDAGRGFGGHEGHGSNEDAAHEAGESAEREAQEDARASTPDATTTAPAPAAATGAASLQ